MSSLRFFVAFELPALVVEELASAQQRMRDVDSAWESQKWVRPENLHLTVSFLGDIDSDQVDEVAGAISRAVVTLGSVRFRIESFAAIPRVSRAAMVWACVGDDDASVQAVHTAVNAALRGLGLAPDRRPFTPHITMVRARGTVRSTVDLAGVYSSTVLRTQNVSDPRLTLYQSRLTPEGPYYKPYGSWLVGEQNTCG